MKISNRATRNGLEKRLPLCVLRFAYLIRTFFRILGRRFALLPLILSLGSTTELFETFQRRLPLVVLADVFISNRSMDQFRVKS